MSTLKASKIQPQSDSDPLIVSTNSTERLRITTNGVVAIGTSSPQTGGNGGVQINADSTATSIASGYSTLVVTNTDATVNNWSRIQLTNNNTAAGGVLIGAQCTDHTNKYFNFSINTKGSDGQKTRLSIDTTGNIGIGTTSPVAKLDVRGTVSISDTGTFPTSSSGLAYNRVLIGGTGPSLFLWDDGSSVAAGRYATVALGSRNATSSTMLAGGYIRGGNEGTTDHSGFLRFDTTPADGSANVERMRIDSNGDVGIGTGNPLCALHVVTSNGPDFPGILIVNDSGGDDQVAGNCMGLRVQVGDGSGTARLLDVRNYDATQDHFIVRKNQTHVLSDVSTQSPSTGAANLGAFLVSNSANTRQLQIGIAHTSTSVGQVWLQGWVPGTGGSDIALNPVSGGGGVAIGQSTITAGFKLEVAGSIRCTSVTQTSDRRAKENITYLNSSESLCKIMDLKPCSFSLKQDGTNSIGLVADEVQSVIPSVVNGISDAVDSEGNPKYQGIDYSSVFAVLLSAVQELSKKVDSQAARIATLEAK